jgi:predicted  nucleic acid-binding Zn-ribbon protein
MWWETNENNKLCQENYKLKRENNDLNQRINSLENKLGDLNGKIRTSDDEKASLRAAIRLLQSEIGNGQLETSNERTACKYRHNTQSQNNRLTKEIPTSNRYLSLETMNHKAQSTFYLITVQTTKGSTEKQPKWRSLKETKRAIKK